MMKLGNRKDVYDLFREGCIWVRAAEPDIKEEGHTVGYRSTRSILRHAGGPLESEGMALRAEYQELLGLEDQAPSVLSDPEKRMVDQIGGLLDASPGVDTIIWEGFSFDTDVEQGDQLREAARYYQAQGKRCLLSYPGAAQRWQRKGYFKSEVRKVYPPNKHRPVVPRGNDYDNPTIHDLIAFCEEAREDGIERAIFKACGVGGFGNHLAELRSPALEAGLRKFRKKPFFAGQTWVTAERYRPFESTFCVTYVIPDGESAPVALECAEQVLSPKSLGFIGSTVITGLSDRDKAFIFEKCMPLVKRMQWDGLRGVIGIDVILCTPIDGSTEIRLPDSGLALIFIEMNPRLNGNNQDINTVKLLEARDGLSLDTLVHMRLGIRPVEGTNNRGDVFDFFLKKLANHGVTRVTRDLVPENGVQFLLDCCHGGCKGDDSETCDHKGKGCRVSLFDAIMFVAHDTPENRTTILACREQLESAGLLRTT